MADFVEVVESSVIRQRVEQLADRISEDYRGKDPVLVGVLVGALPFLADLAKHLSIECEFDFLALNRFGEGGRARIAMDTETSLEGRHVIIVEDIVDTGLTLAFLRRLLEAREVASVATATLLDKAARRIVDVPLEYRGFEVGDEFLLGYGLDWQGRYRNLASLWAVLDLRSLTEDPDLLARLSYGQ